MSLETITTQYVTLANSDPPTRVAYRRLGPPSGIPLVMHIHFRANMDFWDPAFVNALAARRPVILFDQPGVGRSTGAVPETYQGWADDLVAFLDALGLAQIDLLGFSMGGRAVQMAALTLRARVRRLILAGTDASAPTDKTVLVASGPAEPIRQLAGAQTVEEMRGAIAYSFFPGTDAGRAAADAYWARISARRVPGEPLLLAPLARRGGAARQIAASKEWANVPNARNSWARLGELGMPVLVMNGESDALIPTARSWELMQRIPDATLVIWPHAGHGFIWQWAAEVAQVIDMFLQRSTMSKL